MDLWRPPGFAEEKMQRLRGFLWLAGGFLLLAAAIGSAIYIVVHLLNYL
jgi:hypothetical protein